MSTTQQPEALRLSDDLESESIAGRISNYTARKSATLIRRQHAENTTLQAGYAAARLEIESLRAAQPAGAQVETAYGATEFGWTDWRDLQDGDRRLKALVVSLFGNDHQAFADLEALIDRASHGQAPAQASPAAVAGSSDDLVTRESAMQAIEHLAISNSPGREDDAIAMLAAAPTAQPAPHPSPAAQGDALDTARLNFLIEHQAYVVSDETCVYGYWLHYVEPDGTTSVQVGEYETPREAIDAAREAQEGANHG